MTSPTITTTDLTRLLELTLSNLERMTAAARAIAAERDQALTIARTLEGQLKRAEQRERVVADTYNGQQQSYRELETLYQAAEERALRAEAELKASAE